MQKENYSISFSEARKMSNYNYQENTEEFSIQGGVVNPILAAREGFFYSLRFGNLGLPNY